MSWLDEGDVGWVEIGRRDRKLRSPIVVLTCFILALLLLGLWLYLVLGVWELQSPSEWVGIAAGTFLYLVVAYVVHPYQNSSNVGWLGGLIGNPFARSDNLNRLLLFLQVLLCPGRFIAESLVDILRLPTRKRQARRKTVDSAIQTMTKRPAPAHRTTRVASDPVAALPVRLRGCGRTLEMPSR